VTLWQLTACVIAAFGDVFAGIGVREPQANASEAFTQFGEAHREVERFAIKMLQTVKPVSTDYAFWAHVGVSGF